MSYPYGPWGPGQPYGPPPRRFRPMRKLATGVIAVIGGVTFLTILQTVLFWTAISDLEVKLAIVFNDNPDALDRAVVTTVGHIDAMSQITSWACLAAGVLFLVWLWQARENAELLTPNQRHRLSKGWVIGGWFCPAVQLWYPFVVVDDVWQGSQPAAVPGQLASRGGRGILYGWWISFVLYWLVLLVAVPVGVIAVIRWVASLQDQLQTQGQVNDVLLRRDIVQFVQVVGVLAAVLAGLLTIAGITASFLVWRISLTQDARGGIPAPPTGPPPGYQPPGYGPPGYQPHQPQGFPSYGKPPMPQAPPPYGPPPPYPGPPPRA